MTKVFVCYHKRKNHQDSHRVFVVESIGKVVIAGACSKEAQQWDSPRHR